MNRGNLYRELSTEPDEERLDALLETGDVRIERIVSRGHRSPDGFWYDQPRDEWVVLLTGHARLQLETETMELEPGDWVELPARARHRVAWTAPNRPTVWLAVHFAARPA